MRRQTARKWDVESLCCERRQYCVRLISHRVDSGAAVDLPPSLPSLFEPRHSFCGAVRVHFNRRGSQAGLGAALHVLEVSLGSDLPTWSESPGASIAIQALYSCELSTLGDFSRFNWRGWILDLLGPYPGHVFVTAPNLRACNTLRRKVALSIDHFSNLLISFLGCFGVVCGSWAPSADVSKAWASAAAASLPQLLGNGEG